MENDLLESIKQTLSQQQAPHIANVGNVKRVEDGVIILDGCSKVQMGERVFCPEKKISAMVLNLATQEVGAVVLGDFAIVSEGDVFERTGEVMSIPVSDETVGRVVNAIGEPIDGGAAFSDNQTLMPVEKIAPGVMKRQPVTVPLQTGITAIDAMIPVGRGQRELIIGDRSTGKTAIAIDAIINQKNEKDPVICIYVAIGQKQSRVANIAQILKEQGAMSYTTIVAASASDSVAMQYLSVYSATAIGEYFLQQGKDVLIVYDDLTKHAWAYRQISLVLRRPPGREAYPGDIFYLHSRLLERSCRLNDESGGGSITSLPIVETQFGDVSAYIPTNIISITDGQIYLENEMFNAGFRPAIDPSNSVSRVGGAAQTKPMKKVSGQMRLELAQFKELEAFAQFGSADLDEKTRSRIERGRRIKEILKQPQYEPLPVATQIALITAVNEGYLDKISIEGISDFKEQFIAYMQSTNIVDVTELLEDFFKTYAIKE
ncbi:F0F1 ATP synthase subunit alpha [candidate division WWE3 bacterium CG_4_9_14_3_um_filter_41_6]|uniref:ATP synthase subunit alpha n=1 Tax=candidate division WWE3 bacterium CG_4_10_14_0_2_um_filter_41_14 TaxID=1975072 RepID=A0A2M7TJG0_UNCKA|nr:MAG: F0F1 ATP synthase subunit alpha [candidate division WWE3 bacterium CG_4_10_14_0_2_um_filter_41_14]PJA38723.1 MAG: F0F1 ATP synthase subunit alpha [candidate division WWE3 bacterium CG_4_9_14_3_um_filter_41_6]